MQDAQMKDTNYCDAMQSSGEVSAKNDDCHRRMALDEHSLDSYSVQCTVQ